MPFTFGDTHGSSDGGKVQVLQLLLASLLVILSVVGFVVCLFIVVFFSAVGSVAASCFCLIMTMIE